MRVDDRGDPMTGRAGGRGPGVEVEMWQERSVRRVQGWAGA